MSQEESFRLYKSQSIQVARDLKYDSSILAGIKRAKTESEIIRLLRKGRDNL